MRPTHRDDLKCVGRIDNRAYAVSLSRIRWNRLIPENPVKPPIFGNEAEGGPAPCSSWPGLKKSE